MSTNNITHLSVMLSCFKQVLELNNLSSSNKLIHYLKDNRYDCLCLFSKDHNGN